MESRVSQPLRVALDTTFAGTNPTGVGLYSRRLASQLRRVAARENLAFHCVGPACGPHHQTGLRATLQEWPIYTQTVVPAFLAKRRVEIVHSTAHLGPYFGTAKKILTVHDLLFLRYPRDYNLVWLAITKAMLPHLLHRASAVIADSFVTARDLQHFYDIPGSKVHVIYPGFDRPSYPAPVGVTRAEATVISPRSAPFVLCLGPWVGRKNLRVVVAAFARLAARHQDVTLVITGGQPRGMKGDGPDDILRQLSPQARGRVHLVGHLPPQELQETIRNASVLAYPSRSEGFGLPPLEAMSIGVPVIAADTQVAHEVCGDAALYAPPDDPDAWAHLIERVLVDESLRSHIVPAGLKRATHFSWARCARECLALYRYISTLKPQPAP